MTVDLLPVDVEPLVIDFLIADPEVADLFGDGWYEELPASRAYPCGRVQQYDDTEAAGPLWLVRSFLQVDVWGGPRRTTRLAADTARLALKRRLAGVHDQGVVTNVIVSGLNTAADPDQPPSAGRARPRCRFTLQVWTHPHEITGS